MIESLWDGPIWDEYRVRDTVVLHGHETPDDDADRYVVGHDHPTIVIEGQRRPVTSTAGTPTAGPTS